MRFEPPALRHSEAVKLPVGSRVFEPEPTACSRELQSKGRNGSGTFITDNSLAFRPPTAKRLFQNPSTRQIYSAIASLHAQDFLGQLLMAYTPAKMQGKSEIKSAYGYRSFFLGSLIYRNSTWDFRNKPARSKTAGLSRES